MVKLNTLWYCIFQVGCFNGRQWNSTEHRGRRNPCEVKRRLADGLRFVAVIGQRPCHFRSTPACFQELSNVIGWRGCLSLFKDLYAAGAPVIGCVAPRVGPSFLVGYVIQVENTRSTCLPAFKLWNWKSVLSRVWDAVWKWSVSFLLTRTERADCKY